MPYRFVKSLLRRFGIVVYRIDPSAVSTNGPGNLPVYSAHEHNSVERIEEYYGHPDRPSMQVENFRLDLYNEILDIAIANGIRLDGASICDIGCGTGRLLSFVRQRCAPKELHGFDISANAISLAGEVVPGATFGVLDIENNCELPRQFDVVLCSEVIEHLLHPDRALNNILKLVVPGGAAVFTVPDGRRDQFHGHINFWSPESWEVFLESAKDASIVSTGLCNSMPCNYAVIRREG